VNRFVVRAVSLALAVTAALGAQTSAALARMDVQRVPAAISALAPCGSLQTHSSTYQHVITIINENKSYREIIGAASAPYETALKRECGVAGAFYGETYPSLPNYIALTSGAIPAGIAGRDCLPNGTCTSSGPSIFQQLGAGWKVYAESMPSNCLHSNSGTYVPRHTAAPYYTAIAAACQKQQVPLGTTTSGALSADLTSGNLPRYALVVPNLMNDMHDGTVLAGDTWLKTWLPKMIASPAYQNGSTAIFITYDTDDKSAGNHIATIVISPYTHPGTLSMTRFNHYSLLRTQEQMLGLGTYLGAAKTALSMRSAFNL
jgi:phosphatidylinositol-3-phosphatase